MARGNTPPKRQLWRPLKSGRDLAWLERALKQPLLQLLLFVLYIITLVAVMTAGFQPREAPLEADQIGKVARREIKASREFIFEEKDPEATAKQRQRAAELIPPVYDWHEDRRVELRDKVHRAFVQMRKGLASPGVEFSAPAAPAEDESAPQLWPEESESQRIAKLSPEARQELAKTLRAERFDPEFPISLGDEDFALLAQEGFSTRHELLLVGLIDEAMSRMIVTTTGPIETHPKHGISLRRMRQGTLLVEYHMRDVLERVIAAEDIPEIVRSSSRAQASEFKDRTSRLLLLNLAAALIKPNTEYNETLTQEKREAASRAVPDTIRKDVFLKGQLVLDRGQRIDARHVRIYQEMSASGEDMDRAQLVLGMVMLTLLVITVLYLFGRHNLPAFELRLKDYAFMATVLMLFLLIARLGKSISYTFSEQLPAEAVQFGVPIAAGAMLVRLMLKTQHAIIFSAVLSILVGFVLDTPVFIVTYTLIGSLIGIGYVRQVKRRLALMNAGLIIGIANVLMIAGFLLLQGDLFALDSLSHLTLGLLGGLACGSLILAGLPVFEWGFRYTTDIKLLELSDMNHPLLRELILRAPGSYHHSMVVGSLCEAAAEAIGCNSLLARVGAYYHDIGKAKNPGYFAENQKYGENPHDKLKPNMSALILKAHVKDGVEMGRQGKLPQEIIDFIAQHHGTSLIAYFYHKAKQLEDPDIPEVNEKDYRYPGPKPQSRETAICLLADGVEAASRAMQGPTPAKLKGLVQNMINRAFTEGQLDECDLTLKDLNIIAQAFLRILTGIYHHRPEYPDQKKAAQATPASLKTSSPNISAPAAPQTQEPRRRAKPTPGTKSGERPAPKPTQEHARTSSPAQANQETAQEPKRTTQPHAKVEQAQAHAQEKLDGEHGAVASGERPQTPPDQDPKADAKEEGRPSLPRLGAP